MSTRMECSHCGKSYSPESSAPMEFCRMCERGRAVRVGDEAPNRAPAQRPSPPAAPQEIDGMTVSLVAYPSGTWWVWVRDGRQVHSGMAPHQFVVDRAYVLVGGTWQRAREAVSA